MKPAHWLRMFGLAALLAALTLFAACGDDDDDTSAGDDDSGSSSSSGGDPSSSEEKYVATLCKATLDFTEALQKIDPNDFTDEEKGLEAIKEPYQQFVKDIEKAKPTKELKDYHEQAVTQLKAGLKAIEDGDQDGIEALGDAEFPEPPADVSARLEKAAQENDDCKEANVAFD